MNDAITTDPMPAGRDSALEQLRHRRRKALANLTHDLRVPRWDEDGGPKVFVRYRPIEKDWIDEANEKAADLTNDRSATAAAYILAKACVLVFALGPDGTEIRLSDHFDEELSTTLGLDATGAVDTVRSLHFNIDGDLLSTLDDLTVWSGYGRRDLEREYAGN